METTALRPYSRGRDLRRRLALWGAAVATTATIGLGLAAGPASAERHDSCATARAVFRAHMNDAHFFLVSADELAAAGFDWLANQASGQADRYLGLAEDDLKTIEAACA